MPTEQKERSLLKWGFIDSGDVPQSRREYYKDVPSIKKDIKNSPIEE